MICHICKEENVVHFRVKNLKTSNWIFICKKCWFDFAKTEGYKYGGTRKGYINKKRKR